jgi:predicted MFS family arabinose efflux permease
MQVRRATSSGPYATAAGGLLALAAAVGVGRFVYTPILPQMMQALGLGNGAAGLIASANFIGYLAGALLAARPGLGGASIVWLLGSLVVSSVTTAAMGLTTSLPAFLLLRCGGGIASAFALVFSSTIVLERLAELNRVSLSALHFAGVGSGIAVSAVLVAALLHTGQTWQALWLTAGAVSLAATAATALLIRGPAAPAPVSPAARHTAHAGFAPLLCAYGLFGFGYVITATFLVVIVRAHPSLRLAEPLVWVAFGLSAAPSVAFWTWASMRWGIPRTFAVACLVEATGVLASMMSPGVTGACLSAVLVGGTFMGLTALGLVQARSMARGDARRVLGMMTGAFGLGQIIGPTLAGLASDRFGGFQVPLITAAVALAFAALLVLWRPRLVVGVQRAPQ